MKKIFAFCIVAALLIAGCSKGSNEDNGGIINNGNAAKKPVADFDISNAVNNVIGEGRVLQINNLSANAAMYSWEFGNGETSTEANPYFYYGMHGNYHITLRVTGYDGRSSVITKDLTVFCGRTNTNHTPLSAPVL